jgi:hypothetical protein
VPNDDGAVALLADTIAAIWSFDSAGVSGEKN